MPSDCNDLKKKSTVETSRSSSPTRQIPKLKRFLSTLFHFASDISIEIGERVRTLIFALINNALSVEEFHSKIQTTTNFPLRPFALPFLKMNLPLLQKQVGQSARQAKQTTNQFLSQNEHFVILPREQTEMKTIVSNEKLNENGKRVFLNDANHHEDRNSDVKRTAMNSSFSSTVPRREKDLNLNSLLRDFGQNSSGATNDDEWKNVENMLNCILEMATKTKRILFVLQQKDNHFRRLIENKELEWRRRQAELIAQTEDRIVEIRRKAEETVLEIKRQSIVDMQKVLSQNEQKSNESLLREREQSRRISGETKTSNFDDNLSFIHRHDETNELCWFCGRKALETCSACNCARYCGPYCQHRDWENHQKICSIDLKRKSIENPHLYRRPFFKPWIHLSSQQFKEELTNSPARRSNPRSTPTIIPISPDNEERKTNNNDKEEISTVKEENH